MCVNNLCRKCMYLYAFLMLFLNILCLAFLNILSLFLILYLILFVLLFHMFSLAHFLMLLAHCRHGVQEPVVWAETLWLVDPTVVTKLHR